MSSEYPPYPGPPDDGRQGPQYGSPPQGYDQQYGQYGQYGGGQQVSSQGRPYAGWWQRVAALLLDSIIVAIIAVVLIGIGAATAFSGATTDADGTLRGVNAAGVIIMVLGALAALAFQLWNLGIRQGTRGQSLGKKVMNIAVVRETDGGHIGAGAGVLRWIIYLILGNVCFLDLLWPLWDNKKQSWHDKIVSSVVVRTQ